VVIKGFHATSAKLEVELRVSENIHHTLLHADTYVSKKTQMIIAI
jgi:hypothetical protein